MKDEVTNEKPKITFKKVRRKNLREKIEDPASEEEDEKESLSDRLEESKEIRKLRKKHGGITLESLLVGKAKEKKKENEDDPFKTKMGGMIDLATVKNATKFDDAYDTGIGTSFSAETNKRDEDAEMQKFIEENLAKRKGLQNDVEDGADEDKYLAPEEAALKSVPDFLRKSSSQKNEEMLSNQMLNGIPEVDLGLDAKIRNIEATEEAKQKVLKDSLMKKDKPSEFVPKNMAVNFVQHNRFNITDESHAGQKKKHQHHKEKKVERVVEPVVGGGVKISTSAPKRETNEKATDDFHYEKFRKHMKRY